MPTFADMPGVMMYQIVIVVKASIKKFRMCLVFQDTDAFHVLLELTRTKIITSKHFAPPAWRASTLRAQHRAQFGQILTQTALGTLTRQNRYSLIGEVIVQEQTTSSPRAG